MKLTSVAAVARAAQKQAGQPRLASSRAEAPLSRSASGQALGRSASGQVLSRSASGQAPLSLVELSDAVRALQLDSKKREEQCDEAKRLSRDAHQRTGELRKRLDGLDLRCEGLEESFKKGVGAQLVKLRDDMTKAQSDIATLHSSMGTVRQAQERGEHVLRQATDDSRALGLAVSELGHVKQSVQLQQVVSTEQGRVLTDARGEPGSLLRAEWSIGRWRHCSAAHSQFGQARQAPGCWVTLRIRHERARTDRISVDLDDGPWCPTISACQSLSLRPLSWP